MKSHIPGLFLSTIIIFAAGCAQSSAVGETYRVEGKVTFKGKPLTKGSIIFSAVNPDLPSASGALDSQGSYTLTTLKTGDGAPAGEYVVAIRSFEDSGPPSEIATRPPKALVPNEYLSLETTPLRKTVKAETLNTINIEIP